MSFNIFCMRWFATIAVWSHIIVNVDSHAWMLIGITVANFVVMAIFLALDEVIHICEESPEDTRG